MTDAQLLVHRGTFAVLDDRGDITGRGGAAPDGLFRDDARHLSRWRLLVDGAEPTVLVPASGTPLATVLVPSGAGRDEPPACAVIREQRVDSGALTERLRVINHRAEPVEVVLALVADADFADQFELRADGRDHPKPGAERSTEATADGLAFSYRHGDTWHSRTELSATPAPSAVTAEEAGGHRLDWTLHLPPHGESALSVHVTALPAGSAPQPAAAAPLPSTVPTTGRAALDRACAQGLADLDLLRIPAAGPDGEPLLAPAAGIPWFLTLFGRDSLLASLFALDHAPALAGSTLLALAAAQGEVEDPVRLEQHGRIVHEVRRGELAAFRQVPYGRYYGAVDATPLFLVRLGAYTNATGDPSLARRLAPHARAAVDWMFRDGGLDDRGYLVYASDPDGLVNQCWKDSPGAVCFPDGTQLTGRIAVNQVQGYAYDALRRTAALAREVWDDAPYANRLDAAAEDLKSRFLRDSWMPDARFPAFALDGEGRPSAVLTSDAGHLLWSGLLTGDEADAVGRRLLEPDFFSGWGVRTLAAGQALYHPLSYHRGSVWPHDNAMIALGLHRAGLHTEAGLLADALTDAAGALDWRLPEVMAGHDRALFPAPLPYPHSCSPQSWAAATPLALATCLAAS